MPSTLDSEARPAARAAGMRGAVDVVAQGPRAPRPAAAPSPLQGVLLMVFLLLFWMDPFGGNQWLSLPGGAATYAMQAEYGNASGVQDFLFALATTRMFCSVPWGFPSRRAARAPHAHLSLRPALHFFLGNGPPPPPRGCIRRGGGHPVKEQQPDGMSHRGAPPPPGRPAHAQSLSP